MNIPTIVAANDSSIVSNGLISAWDVSNPKSYYPNSRILYDLSSTQNNATFLNGASISYSASCLLFDGSTTALTSSLNCANNIPQMSLSVWAVANNTSIGMVMCNDDATDAVRCWLFSPGVECGIYTSAGRQNNVCTQSLHVWIHTCMVYNGTNITAYVNGVNQPFYNIAQTGTIVSRPAGATINLGAEVDTAGNRSFQFTGSISQWLIYNRAISAAEVLQNYNASKSRFGY